MSRAVRLAALICVFWQVTLIYKQQIEILQLQEQLGENVAG